MLTKDLVKFTKRGGQVYPKSLAQDEWGEVAESLIHIYTEGVGKRFGDLDNEAHNLLHTHPAYIKGLKKLLDDGLELEDDDTVLALREKALNLAEELRPGFKGSPTEFRSEISLKLGMSEELLRVRLYGDLQEEKLIKAVSSYTPQSLIERFNLAQVQGLLLRAKQVEVTLGKMTPLAMRKFFRNLKFHRLLAQIKKNKKGEMSMSLGGPLSMFENSQAYAMRLVNFLPHIVGLKDFKLEATLAIEKEDFVVKISSDDGYISHYNQKSGYVPEEFDKFITAFSKLKTDWKLSPGSSLQNLGGQEYCFPDWLFQRSEENQHMELFHRWHKTQLIGRLQTLAKRPKSDLIVGVCSSLQKDSQISEMINESEKNGVGVIVFKGLPTARAVLAQLG